jgi:hypothetical protein
VPPAKEISDEEVYSHYPANSKATSYPKQRPENIMSDGHYSLPLSLFSKFTIACVMPLDGVLMNAMTSDTTVDRMKQQRAIPSQLVLNHSNI